MEKYDIYVAHLSFNSNGNIIEENTPVLILDPNRLLVLLVKCTHHWVRMCNELDYDIQEYSGTGLNRDTVIMFDYPLHIDKNNLLYKIGKLNNYDIQYVKRVADSIILNN